MSIATVVFLIVLSIRIGTALTRRAQGTAPPGPKRRTIEDHRGVIGASWLLCGGAFIIALFNLSGTTTPVRALVLTVSTLLLFPWWFARGLAMTLALTGVSITGGLALGIVLGPLRSSLSSPAGRGDAIAVAPRRWPRCWRSLRSVAHRLPGSAGSGSGSRTGP